MPQPWRDLVTRLPVDPDLEEAPLVPQAPPSPWALGGAVALGGVAGSLARAGVATAWPHNPAQWPWPTLVVNATGSCLLAFLVVLLAERWPRARWARPLLGTGVMGGYTTFSTFAVDTVQLVHHHRAGVAGAYVVASVAGSIGFALAGLALARAADRLADTHRWERRAAARGPQ